MNHFLLVNVVKRDTDHCKNSKNIFFWNLVIFIASEEVSKALVALFHNKARVII